MSNQPIEEEWKEEFNKKFCSKTSEPKYSVWNAAALAYPEEIKSFIENLLEQERNHYEKELKIADERWKRAEANHREKHESETEICVYH